MQPNLFAGPTQRDSSYRILARLANGGAVPARPIGWRIDATLKARLAVTAGLLSLAALAWVWLPGAQAPHSPAQAAPAAAAAAAPPTPAPNSIEASEPQAATIVSQAVAPDVPVAAATRESSAPAGKPGMTAREPVKQTRRATPQAAPSARSAAPVESDEDVNLLAAMLKHAKPQKPPVTPPAKN